MDRLVFIAASSIDQHAISRQQLVHELANLSTIGFKKSFESAQVAVEASGSGFNSRIYSEIIPERVIKDKVSLSGGPVMITGKNLDIALNGNTVLGVSASDGTLAFTRRGDLRVNTQGMLENGSGHMVLGEQGPITVPPGYHISISSDGAISASDPAQPDMNKQMVGKLMLRDAGDVILDRRKDGLFAVAEKLAGTDIMNKNPNISITTGALEGSNVNAIESMVKLMDDSRSFEQQIRLIKECKDIHESGTTMMRMNS
jgi:flagellar basal-body rod protein FlgF